MNSVLVIDDHSLIRSSLALALGAAGLDVHIARFGSGQDILDSARELPPALAVLDLDLGRGANGQPIRELEIIDELVHHGWRVFILSGSSDCGRIAAAVAAGAVGWATKSGEVEDIVTAITSVAAGRPGMSDDQRRALLQYHSRLCAEHRDHDRRMARLSGRERQVLELMAHGMRAAAIADEFVVSVTTVRSQIRSILTKLEASSQLAAVAMFNEHNQLARTN